MGLLERIFGIELTGRRERKDDRPLRPSGVRPAAVGEAADRSIADTRALERYRYMLKTAPPETIEQAHAEAFAQLTPEQRRHVLTELSKAAPPEERAAAGAVSPDDARAMGRLATRTEMRQPGFMERTFAPGMGMGLGGSLLASFAMGFAGSMVAHSFFSALEGLGHADAYPASDLAGAPDESREDALTDTSTEMDLDDMDDIGDVDLGDLDV